MNKRTKTNKQKTTERNVKCNVYVRVCVYVQSKHIQIKCVPYVCLPYTLLRLLFAVAAAAAASAGVNDFGFFHSFFYIFSGLYSMEFVVALIRI